MLKNNSCTQIIENTYLKETKKIKAKTQKELQQKINQQIAIWEEREKLQKEKNSDEKLACK